MKYILKMAFRNIGRNKRRTMLSAIAISIAVMVILFMRGYIGGIIDSTFDSLTKIETGHIKISHTKFHEKQDMMPLEYMVDGFDGGGYEQMIPVLESVDDVEVVVPRIKFGVLLSFKGKSRTSLGVGIDPEAESKITDFGKIMVDGEYFEGNKNARTMIIGEGLANKLGIEVNDKITILTQSAFDAFRGMTFKVIGIFRYGISTMDSKLFYTPIGTASRLLEMGNAASELMVMIDKPEEAEKVAKKIKDKFQSQKGAYLEDGDKPRYAVVPWQKQEGMLSMFDMATTIYNFFYVGLLVLASTVIINTTMMVIYERTKEIGTIGALGMTGRQIVLLFVVEAMLISVIGSFLGTLVGGGVDLAFSIIGIDLNALTGGSMDLPTADVIYPRFGLSILLWSFLFGVVVATAIAYFPARRAARIEPVEALRSI
jgi:putative ABC transport system permease protein